MRRPLLPILIILAMFPLILAGHETKPDDNIEQDSQVTVVTPEGTPVTDVVVVTSTTEQSLRFLDRCRSLFEEDKKRSVALHAQYLTDSQNDIIITGHDRTILELMGAQAALTEFMEIEQPSRLDRTILCLALEPVMMDTTSTQ